MRANVFLILLAACGGGGDECERFFAKMKPVMQKAGEQITDAQLKEAIEECRKDRKAAKPKSDDKVFRCVLDAKDDAAVGACIAAPLEDYRSKAKRSEAELQLNKLGKTAKVEFTVNSTFPIGKAGPIPIEPCCKSPQGKCPVPPAAAWADPVWTALDFQLTEPSFYQYSYESDGKTATIKAVGDLDCDDNTVTYTMKLTSEGGNPTMTLDLPPTGAD